MCPFVTGLFHEYDILKTHPSWSMSQDCLPFKSELYPILCICYILFIHSIHHRHLSGVYLLAVSRMSLEKLVPKYLSPCFKFFGVYNWKQNRKLCINSMFACGGTATLFSTGLAPFYMIASQAQVFQFLRKLDNTCNFQLKTVI